MVEWVSSKAQKVWTADCFIFEFSTVLVSRKQLNIAKIWKYLQNFAVAGTVPFFISKIIFWKQLIVYHRGSDPLFATFFLLGLLINLQTEKVKKVSFKMGLRVLFREWKTHQEIYIFQSLKVLKICKNLMVPLNICRSTSDMFQKTRKGCTERIRTYRFDVWFWIFSGRVARNV